MSGPLHPSSRLRAWQYVPHLEAASFRVRVINRLDSGPAGYGARLALSALGSAGVYLQKRVLPPVLLRAFRSARIPVVYDFDDALFASEDGSPAREAGRFRQCLRLVAHVVAGNEYLAEYARELNPNVSVIPTPVRVQPYARRVPDAGRLRVVWIGSSSTIPHLRGIADALAEASRQVEGLSVKVIASGPVELPGTRATFVPWTLDGEEREIAECDVGLMPLPDNPRTRGKCAYKALQCMALGLPVIVSPVGMSREVVEQGREGLWASSSGEWVERIRQLARSPELVAEMGRAAHAKASGFSVDRCADTLISILDQLTGPEARTGAARR
jgi:glycosyltransferase involved in cell wall biosynthesis